MAPALLALLTSINTLYNGFVFDDIPTVLNNAFIQSLGNLQLAFTHSVWAFRTESVATAATDAYYRPLFTIWLAVNYAVFGSTAWGWHLINVLTHVGVTLLTFLCIRELTENKWLAVMSACLFAVHPLCPR